MRYLAALASAVLLAVLTYGARAAARAEVQWAGRGQYRLLVKVDPVGIGRASDESPARVAIDFAAELARLHGAAGRRPDIASIQVVRYDPATGRPLPYGRYAYATGPYDRPFRWYDAAIPADFPENEAYIDQTGGELRHTPAPMWGYYYNVIGDWQRGQLAWAHTQEGGTASHYAVYFDLLPEGGSPREVPPRGLLGDGLNRAVEQARNTTGLIHTRVGVGDWDGDGLIDLIAGSARGSLVFYPNAGSRAEPEFPYSKLVFLADGRPLDVGWSSAPVAADWDGDGVKDLVMGAEWGRVVFVKNEGSNAAPRWVSRGLVKLDGQPLKLPHRPCPEDKGEIYKRDYYPVPEVVDWDGDGDLDLLAGGYVTGQVFYFENVAKEPDGTPRLAARGALEADGEPVDVGWAAAPAAADFDSDGDLDLITGAMPMTAGGGDSHSSENFLTYYENVGTRTRPRLARRPMPKRGTFPDSALGTPRAADLSGDGLLDLVVSAGTNIYYYKNTGTRTAPRFEAHAEPLPSRWGSETVPSWGVQYLDWNGDGRFDILSGLSVSLNLGRGNPGLFGPPQSILPPGDKIEHRAPMGDDWHFIQLADLDGDGRADVLFGDHGGNVYFHRNLGAGGQARYETGGLKLQTQDGKPIKVGPAEGQAMDFDVLQGARTTFTAADFDGDGRVDLVVGDTYGKVRFYRNERDGTRLSFARPVLIGDMKIRMVPAAADWNNDGLLDVIGAAANGRIELFAGGREAGKWGFAPGAPLKVPGVPYGPTASVVDWNDDGDADLVVSTAYSYTCLFENSFLKHGYREAERVGWEKR